MKAREPDAPKAAEAPPILVVMGVSGAGKTVVANALAARLGWPEQEGDLLHPANNIAKMRGGTPLTDADRAPWLAAVAAWIDERRARREPGIVTCSALKRAYRQLIVAGRPNVRLVFLRADAAVIARRLERRRGHFMPATLLPSQFETLEEPGPDEATVTVDAAQPVAAITDTLIRQLGLATTAGR